MLANPADVSGSKMKKGSADMWWIIIGAVIALVVLIILMVIFTGKTNILESGLLDCQGKGGSCDFTASECITKGTVSHAFECSNPANIPEESKKVCCFGVKKASGEGCEKNSDCISGTCEIRTPLATKVCT